MQRKVSRHAFAFNLSFCVLDEDKNPKVFRERAQEGSVIRKTGFTYCFDMVTLAHRVNESVLQKNETIFRQHKDKKLKILS